MKKYLVHFSGFSPKIHKALLSQLHLKYFKTVDSGDITRTHPEPGAHMFHVISEAPRGDCCFEVSMISKWSVQIQMISTKGGEKRTILKPQTFNLNTLMHTARDKRSLEQVIASLIVKSSFAFQQ